MRWRGGTCRCIILSVITIAPFSLGSPAGQQKAGATGIAARPRTPTPAAPSRPGSTAPGKASRSGSPLGTRSSKSHSQTASGGLKHECTCTIRGFTRTSSWQTSSSLSGLGRRLPPPRGDIVCRFQLSPVAAVVPLRPFAQFSIPPPFSPAVAMNGVFLGLGLVNELRKSSMTSSPVSGCAYLISVDHAKRAEGVV